MGEDRQDDLLDVVGQDVVAPLEGGDRRAARSRCSDARGEAPSRSEAVCRVAVTRSTTYCRIAGEVHTSRTTRIIRATVAASVVGPSSSSGDAPPCRSSMATSAAADGYPIEMRAMKRSRWASGSG